MRHWSRFWEQQGGVGESSTASETLYCSPPVSHPKKTLLLSLPLLSRAHFLLFPPISRLFHQEAAIAFFPWICKLPVKSQTLGIFWRKWSGASQNEMLLIQKQFAVVCLESSADRFSWNSLAHSRPQMVVNQNVQSLVYGAVRVNRIFRILEVKP